MKTTQFWVGILIVLLVTSICATAAPLRKDERIVRDPVTGDYTAYFWAEDEEDAEMATASFVTATKIDPAIRSDLKLIDSWNVRYAYRVSNGAKAKQPIVDISLYGLPVNARISNSIVVPSSDGTISIEFFESALSVPNAKWSGSGARTDKGINMGWLYSNWSPTLNRFDTSLGLQPNEKLGGFGFTSCDLPGILIAKLHGNTVVGQFDSSYEYPDRKVTDIARQMGEIVANDFVPYNVAAPIIIVPTPFDPAVLLDNLRAHVATWPSKQLADAAFAVQLDRYLAAAADAYRRNQLKAGKEHLAAIHEMLEKEHKHLDGDEDEAGEKSEHKPTARPNIDRLAARVLDFDLKYVLKRMERDEDERNKK